MRSWSKRDVLSYLDRVMPTIKEADYFVLLDVSVDANKESVQAAFHNMAAGLHPDRHRTLNPEQYEKLIIVYARIAEAYRVLRNPRHKEKYLRKIAKEKPTKGPTKSSEPSSELSILSPKAQQLYRRAMAAKRTGDLASAKLNLRMALSKHPQSGFLKTTLKELAKTK